MSKKETLEQVTKLLVTHKIKPESELFQALTKMFEPKKVGHSIEFPDKVDKDGNITEKYCSWFKEYRPAADFNKKGDKLHYECKDAEKEWYKYAKAIKDTKTEMADLTNAILDEKVSIDEGKAARTKLVKHIEALEASRLAKINFADFKQSTKQTKGTKMCILEEAIESMGLEEYAEDIVEGYIYNEMYYVQLKSGLYFSVIGNDSASGTEARIKQFIDDFKELI